MAVVSPRCPMCGTAVAREGNRFRPFCSERCQLIDLSNWMGERYRIPADDIEDESESPSGTDDPE